MNKTTRTELLKFFQRLGIRITEMAGEFPQSANVSHCPFGAAAVNWKTKRLYLNPDERTAAVLIHEAGHLVASRTLPKNSHEPDFLGWERAVALKFGVEREWLRGHDDYGVEWYGEMYELRELKSFSKSEREEFWASVRRDGWQYGNLNRRGNPVAVR